MSLGFIGACGSESTGNASSSSGATPGVGDAGTPACTEDREPPQTRSAACPVTLAVPGFQEPSSKHVPEGTQVAYCSNPPTSGPHYSVWADFKEYTSEVPWPYLVHSEEHGGTLLLYKCEQPCPEIVEQLRGAVARAPVDNTCDRNGRVGLKRIIIAPSSTIPTRVAAAAWGATYTADCVDEAMLDEFIATRGQRGTEDLCFAGRATF